MLEISALVAGMTTPQAAATVVAAAYASYCALRYVYRRAHTGVAHKQAPAMVAAAPGGRAAASAPPGRADADVHVADPYGSRLGAAARSYSFTGKAYFNSDGCSDAIAARREKGANALAQRFDALMGAKAKQLNDTLVAGLSDIRFTDTNRVPFQFQKETRARYRVASITQSSEGPVLVDVDGGRAIDVSGSYGVNVCGYDAYKGFVDRAWSRVKDLGPNVLGPVHPIISDVLPALKKIANKEEVSFHMSGTEAVMCAVRLCRFNTGRKLIVQFAGAYHGWWDGVQPGPGSERANSDVLYLNDMSPAALRCIAARADEIACVCVSPLQGLNPGSPPPSDLVLLDAKEYYGVDADVVVYGKTLGGGLANGVVCGPARLMKRFDEAKPVRVAYVIGTFSAAPLTLATMAEFLAWVQTPATIAAYADATARTDAWVHDVNVALAAENLPMRVDNLTTVWTVLFTQPGRYHWMFQYYLRAEGLAVYDAVKTALLNAAKQMRTDGWWDGDVDAKSISKDRRGCTPVAQPSASRPTEPAAGAPPPSAPDVPIAPPRAASNDRSDDAGAAR
ncbi:N2-acetyl-L-ornithine:2-oxoglutarate 5-aminotransferase [Aureococcus anophagefferens]|nr:N2-acetyl-L-ornithine:2-oxoglutarate 5-aminotransferase [Aureococcus anophagefferens]